MAIIRMTSNRDYVDGQHVPRETFPDGAYCPLANREWMAHHGGVTFENCVVLYQTHHGLCLFERERNMHDDSDFMMTVWDPEAGEPKSITFATTRGWTYPCYGSFVDATPEVLAAYEDYKRRAERRRRIQARWDRRRYLRETAALCLMSVAEFTRLVEALGPNELQRYVILLKTGNFRSEFRKSLAEQVRTWAADPNPAYPQPLSRRQASYL